MKALRFLVCAIAWIAAVVCAAWAFGALYFDFPTAGAPVAFLFALVLITASIFARGRLLKLAIFFGAFALVALWWLTLKPSNHRPWQPDVAQTAWAQINGDSVTLHNVRNCDYRAETDFTPHWETRTVRPSQITGMDVAINYWGSPWIAHPIVSFQFSDGLPLCFSIETRKTIGQKYSTLEGFYRRYTLIYVVADERDVVRLRTNYRREDVYLYHTLASPEQARERFGEYIETVNALYENPRWYNAVTSNCTTSIRAQRAVEKRAPWDWRILLNGKVDEMLYDHHAIATGGLPFAELKQRSLINKRARAAERIRISRVSSGKAYRRTTSKSRNERRTLPGRQARPALPKNYKSSLRNLAKARICLSAFPEKFPMIATGTGNGPFHCAGSPCTGAT